LLNALRHRELHHLNARVHSPGAAFNVLTVGYLILGVTFYKNLAGILWRIFIEGVHYEEIQDYKSNVAHRQKIQQIQKYPCRQHIIET
jgi:hypothetical protein